MKTGVSQRILEMKSNTGVRSDVEFGKLAGAAKSVVGQWIAGSIKSINPRYAYKLEKNTGYQARWIMLGEGTKKVGKFSNLNQIEINNNIPAGLTMVLQKLSKKDVNLFMQLVQRLAEAKTGKFGALKLIKKTKKVK